MMRKTWVQTGVGNLYWILTLQEPHFLNLSNGGDMCILCYENNLWNYERHIKHLGRKAARTSRWKVPVNLAFTNMNLVYINIENNSFSEPLLWVFRTKGNRVATLLIKWRPKAYSLEWLIISGQKWPDCIGSASVHSFLHISVSFSQKSIRQTEKKKTK